MLGHNRASKQWEIFSPKPSERTSFLFKRPRLWTLSCCLPNFFKKQRFKKKEKNRYIVKPVTLGFHSYLITLENNCICPLCVGEDS